MNAMEAEPLQSLQQEAQAYFTQGDYKKALVLYKQCWKQAANDQHREALRDCYLGRARQLAAQHMPREAVVMWENHRPYCTDCRHGAFYIRCLLTAGLWAKAVIAFQEVSLTLSPTEATFLEEIFAALLLSDDPDIQKMLSHSNAALRQQAQIARQVLDMFCQSPLTKPQSVQLEEGLKQIPFRSPYRYFRQVVKACLLIPEDRSAALAQLQAIPETSVFFRWAWVSQWALAEEFRLAQHVSNLTAAEWGWVSGLRGLTSDQQKGIDRIRKLEPAASPAPLLGVMLRQVSCFEPQAAAKQACYHLLPGAMGEQAAYEKVFGPLQPIEKKQLQTLALLDHPQQTVCPHCVWLAFEKSLSHLSVQDGQTALKRALVLRQAATYAPEPDNIPVLAKSVTLDPADKPTYLTLIHYYQRTQQNQPCQFWLQKAVQHFPQDPELLKRGIDIAHQQGKIQQAVQYCHTLLRKDPLNTAARHYLVRRDIRKMQGALRQRQWDTARKQFTALQRLYETVDPTIQTWMHYYRILFEYLGSNKTTAESLIRKDCPGVQENAVERVAFYLEALSAGMTPQSLEQDLALKPIELLTFKPSTLAPLFETLSRCINKNAIKQVYLRVEKPLKRVLSQSMLPADFEQINEVLSRSKQFQVMRYFIRAQAPRFSHFPLFHYYKLFAKVKGRATQLTATDCDRLEYSMQKALDEGDIRVAHKIQGFLAAYDDTEGVEDALSPEIEEELTALMNQ